MEAGLAEETLTAPVIATLNGRMLPAIRRQLGFEKVMADWVDVCAVDEIEIEDVIRFDHGGRTFAVYRDPKGEVFCTDGLCTHEQVHLADGLVLDDTIECPMHNGRFNYKTGEALRTPACIALATYPARVREDRIEAALDHEGKD